MSILLKPRPAVQTADDGPVEVFAGDPPLPGEPIPARFSAADRESIRRVGHAGAAPVEPLRRSTPDSPSQAEAQATSVGLRCAGPRESVSPYMLGAYRVLYGELYQHYLDAQQTIARMRPHYYPFLEDELPDAEAYASSGYNS